MSEEIAAVHDTEKANKKAKKAKKQKKLEDEDWVYFLSKLLVSDRLKPTVFTKTAESPV